jgi:hypothetical protein
MTFPHFGFSFEEKTKYQLSHPGPVQRWCNKNFVQIPADTQLLYAKQNDWLLGLGQYSKHQKNDQFIHSSKTS